MGRKYAQRLGRHVYARVLGVFNEAEAGRKAASALRLYFPRSAATLHDKGGVGSEPRVWRTSWRAPPVEAGGTPTATTRGRPLPV